MLARDADREGVLTGDGGGRNNEALQALGERESGIGGLEEAVNAFRNALTEWTRERVPLESIPG